jgi:multidrug efflux pump subunit AcrB
VLAHRRVTIAGALVFTLAGLGLYPFLQRELVPEEDRGIFLSFFKGPLGATPSYTRTYVEQMERIVLDIPEVARNFSITAVGFGSPGVGNEGLMFTGLVPWEERERKTQQVIGQLFGAYGQEITGGLAFPVPVRPLGRGLAEQHRRHHTGGDERPPRPVDWHDHLTQMLREDHDAHPMIAQM